MDRMVEVKTTTLAGAALDFAWLKVTGKKATQTVHLLPTLARHVIAQELGDTVSVPAELLENA